MTVYVLYIPTARFKVSDVGMEAFASRELTGRILKERNHTRHSRTFYLDDGNPRRVGSRPEKDFPDADETGYMRVFLRLASDPAPGLRDNPDEEWIVEPGGAQGRVSRLPWSSLREKMRENRRTQRLTVTPRMPDPPVLRPSVMRISCHRDDCKKQFEAPAAGAPQFIALYREHGWRARGWVTGYVYYCPQHIP